MIPVEVLNAWGAAWWGFMARALIDASVLLVLVLVVWLPLRRRMSAQLAHGLFCLVLLKLVVPAPAAWLSGSGGLMQGSNAPAKSAAATARAEPLVLPTTGDMGVSAADSTRSSPVVSVRTEAPAKAARPTPIGRARLSLAAGLMIGWGCVATLLLMRFGLAMAATRRLIRNADRLGADWLAVDTEALRRSAGIRSRVRWAVSPRLHSPAVGGLIRPTVVIPPDLDDGLSPEQLSWVLLHELAHIRRGDLWVVVSQRVAQAVFFFHPAVYVANWLIDQLREFACDDAALAACETSRRACGEGFLTVVGRAVERPPAASAALGLFESRLMIRRRLVRILDSRRTVHQRLTPRATFALLAAALVALPYGRAIDASARSGPKVPANLLQEATDDDNAEPASYRPGEVWHRETATTGARASVLALTYSPDGNVLATAGEGGTIVLRDRRTGQQTARLEGHRDAVSALAFSPDGKTLASGGYDRTVRLWDVAGGRASAVLEGHTNWVFAVAFSPDGRSVASAGHDKGVRLWDVATGRERAALSGHSASVRSVAFSPDGARLASGGADRSVFLWDPRTGTRLSRLEGHRGVVRAVAFSPDSATLATAGEDGEARLWDVAGGRQRAALTGHTDMVLCLAFSPRGGTLATGSLDATVKLWDLGTARERATLQGHHDGISALTFAPGARQLATASFDGSVRFWEPAAPVFSAAACLASSCKVDAVAFSPDGQFVFGAGKTGVNRWNTASGESLGSSDPVESATLAVNPDGRTYATAGPDGTVRLVDAAQGTVRATFPGPGGAIRSVAFSADGRWLAAGGQDGGVRLWELSTRRVAHEFAPLPLPVVCVRFSPDGRTLAAATSEAGPARASGVVALRDVATGAERGLLRERNGGVASVAFAPGGQTIATAGVDGTITLWDARTLKARRAWRYTKARSIDFSPDGRMLASAHQGGEVVLWDARSGRQRGVLKGHRGEVSQVVFALDGHRLATGGSDGSVKLWNLASRRQTARATLDGDMADVWSVAYAPDGKTLAVAEGQAGSTGRVNLWDIASRRLRTTLDGHEQGVASALFSPDGKTIATGDRAGTVIIRDASGRERFKLTGLTGVSEMAFSPDGLILATAGEGKFVTLWDVETGDERARLDGFRDTVQCLAFSPDGTRLATGCGMQTNAKSRGEVKVWDVTRRTPTPLSGFEGHTNVVLTLAFSPDGRSLASGGLDQTVRIWDVASGQARLTLGGLGSCVQSVAFARDGRLLAWSGRNDGLVAVHDGATGSEVSRLVGHGAAVRSLAFAPDGTGLATGGFDGKVKLWDLPGATPPPAAIRGIHRSVR